LHVPLRCRFFCDECHFNADVPFSGHSPFSSNLRRLRILSCLVHLSLPPPKTAIPQIGSSELNPVPRAFSLLSHFKVNRLLIPSFFPFFLFFLAGSVPPISPVDFPCSFPDCRTCGRGSLLLLQKPPLSRRRPPPRPLPSFFLRWVRIGESVFFPQLVPVANSFPFSSLGLDHFNQISGLRRRIFFSSSSFCSSTPFILGNLVLSWNSFCSECPQSTFS